MSSSESELPTNAADLWLNLKSRVGKGREESRPLPNHWRYNPSLDVSREQAETAWLAACHHVCDRVDQLVARWISTGEFQETDQQLRYFFCVRFDVAHELLTYLTFLRDGEWTTIFPFPRSTPNEVLSQLLVDWWRGIGQFCFFDRAYDNKMIV